MLEGAFIAGDRSASLQLLVAFKQRDGRRGLKHNYPVPQLSTTKLRKPLVIYNL